jgi:cyclase
LNETFDLADVNAVILESHMRYSVYRNCLTRLFTILTLSTGTWLAYALNPLACATNIPAELAKQCVLENKLVKITSDLYVIAGDGSNSTVYLTDEGVILVDDKFERDYDDIQAKIKSLTDKQVRYVINTHHHPSSAGGNERWRNSAQIIAHSNARANMVQEKLSGAPDITFTDEMTINLGGKEVVVRHFGRAHTNSDIVVYFPGPKVVVMGDVFNLPPWGVAPDYNGGGSILEHSRTLDGALQWDFNVVIPGHGAPLAKRADLISFRASLIAVRDRISTMIREGKSKEDMTKVLISEFGWSPTGGGIGAIDDIISELSR